MYYAGSSLSDLQENKFHEQYADRGRTRVFDGGVRKKRKILPISMPHIRNKLMLKGYEINKEDQNRNRMDKWVIELMNHNLALNRIPADYDIQTDDFLELPVSMA